MLVVVFTVQKMRGLIVPASLRRVMLKERILQKRSLFLYSVDIFYLQKFSPVIKHEDTEPSEGLIWDR